MDEQAFRPQWQFKFQAHDTLTNDVVFHNAWKRIIYHFINKEGHVVDGTIRNVVFAFIWFSFATVYERLPHPPLPTMAIATLVIATVSLGGTISLCEAAQKIRGQ